jgi:hypothetical protein
VRRHGAGGRSGRWRRARRIGSPALAALALATGAAACGGSGDPHSRTTARGGARGPATAPAAVAPRNSGPHPGLGPFAGYDWTGTVHSVHADWTVPRVTAATPAGQAAAWVGAEAPGRNGHAPFVQVGVHEGNTAGPPGTPPVFYYAFYSTTKLGFTPKLLFEVQPGDVVSATLRRTGRRWHVEIEDLTSGRHRSLTTTEGAGHTFNEAQINQEDVTDSRTGHPYPYPSLSALRFSAVSVNGRAPAAGRLDTTWLTEAVGYLAPGPLRHRSFALAHVSMSRAAYRYLRAIAAQDAAETGGMPPLARWANGGAAEPAFADARHLAAVLHRTTLGLSATRWPPAARRPIAAVRADAGRLVVLLGGIRDVPDEERITWAQQFFSLVSTLGRQGQAARAALGLPSSATLPPG